jgi:hypothetical protein
MLSSPALAKNSESQKVSEPAVASPCSSYMLDADGTWKPIPCRELGSPPEQRTRPATHSTNQSR